MSKFKNTVVFLSRFILILLIFLPLMIYGILTINPVQQLIEKKLIELLEENLNTEIELSSISYVPPFDFVVKDFFIRNINNNDTLIYVSKVKVRPVFYSFHKNKLIIDKVDLNGLHFEYCVDSSGYSNLDYFLANMPPSEDTTTSESNFTLLVRSIENRNSSIFYTDATSDSLPYDLDLDTINLYQIDFRVNEFEVNDTAISLQLMKFRAYDKSGFQIKNLSSEFKLQDSLIELNHLALKTNYSNLLVDKLRYISDTTIGNDYFDVIINELTTLNPLDLGFFSKKFKNYSMPVNLSLWAEGKLADLNIHSFRLAYGNYTIADFEGQILGLPNISNTYFDINASRISTCKQDLAKIKNPQTGEPIFELKSINMPDSIMLTTSVTGITSSLYANGKVLTSNGNIDFDLNYYSDSTKKTVNGIVDLNAFNVGKLLDNSMIGKISMHDSVDLTLKKDKIFADNHSKIFSFDFNGYTYNDIVLTTSIKDKIISVDFLSKDKNFKSALVATFKDGKNKSLNFSFKIDTANLDPLNFAKDDPASFFSTGIKGSLSWKEIKDINGKIHFSKPLVLIKNLQKLEMSQLDIDIKNMYFYGKDIYKFISIKSDFFDAYLQGVIDPALLAKNLSNIPAYYFTSLADSQVVIFSEENEIKNNFRLSMQMKDLSPILNIFAPTIYISPGTKIDLITQNQKHKYSFNIYSDSLNLSSVVATKVYAKATADTDRIKLNLTADSVGMSDIHFNNLSIGVQSDKDTAKSVIKWKNNTDKKNQGRSRVNISFKKDSNFTKMQILLPGDTVFINDYKWIIKKSEILIDSNSVKIKDLAFISRRGGMFALYGIIGDNIKDTLNMLIEKFDISQLNPLLPDVLIKGFVNTKFKAIALTDSSRQLFMSNIISKLKINDVSLGVINHDLRIIGDTAIQTNLTLSSVGKSSKTVNGKIIYVDTLRKSLNINGIYNLNSKKYDFVLDIVNLKFSPFRKYFEDYLSIIKTTNLNGKLHVSGNKILYDVEGFLNLYGSFTVKPTGVRYSLNDGLHLKFSHNKIIIEKSVLTGPQLVGDMTVWGTIKHNSFRDMYLDIFLDADTIRFLDKPRNKDDSYFGTVVASADAELFGYLESLTLKADVTAEKQTNLTYLLNKPGDVSNKTGILNFVNYADTTINITDNQQDKESNYNFNIDLNLTLNPEAKFRLLMDELTGEGFEMQGSGNVKIKQTTFGNLVLVGRIEIEKGIYNFVLQNIINKKFKIQKGSYITFNGDPMDGVVDITTLYTVKNVNLYNLLQDDNYAGQKTQADCYIYLKGPITKPQITFDVKLPKADRKIASQVSSLDEANMNKQFLSLLLIGRFQPLPGLVYDPNANLAMGNFNPGELISNQLNSLLSNLGTDVNLDINYQTGDQATTDQLDVAVSVPLMNERISINTDVGVGGKNEVTTDQNNFIGDFEVDAKLNKKGNLILKAYNKNNRNDFYEQGYTKGIGIQYKTSLDKIFFKEKKEK